GHGRVVMYGNAAWQAMSELAPGSPWKAMVLPALLPARAPTFPLAISSSPDSTQKTEKPCKIHGLRRSAARRPRPAWNTTDRAGVLQQPPQKSETRGEIRWLVSPRWRAASWPPRCLLW